MIYMYIVDFFRKNAAAEVVPPLLTVTTEKAKSIINQRAEEILSHPGTAANNAGALEPDDDDNIPCTPAFPDSELGGGGGNGYKYKAASLNRMKPGTTAVMGGLEGRDGDDDGGCHDDDAVVLLEDGDEKRFEINDESAVNLCDAACPADTDASPKSTDGVLSNDDKQTGPMQLDSVTKTGEKVAEDDEATCMSLGDESERSGSEDTPLHVAMETASTEHDISFHEDLQEVDYPTLWQLTAEETRDVEHFYVPALVPVISPVKVHLYKMYVYMYIHCTCLLT
jgi:hypothetical protein